MTDQPAPIEARRAAADAFDAAHARTLDQGQITAAIADAVWPLALAEGRRQATEGWDRESSVRYPDGFVCSTGFTDEGARRTAAETDGELVSRLVGPWEATEQEPASHARGCCCGWNDAGQRFIDLICKGR